MRYNSIMDPVALERLVQLARALSNFPSLEDLVQEIIDTAASLTGAESVSLLLHDEADGKLHYAGVSWCDDPERLAALEQLSVPLDTGASGWVFRQKKPLRAARTGRDPLVHPAIEQLLGSPVVSAAGVPLEYRQRVIGVLECLNARGGHFAEADLEILATLASLASVAIYDAHLTLRADQSSRAMTDLERLRSEFISIASHELRTPLGVIIGHTAVLQEIADRQMREQLDVIARNASQLREIIENLTALNQVARPGIQPQSLVSLNQVVLRLLEERRHEAQTEGVALEAALPEATVLVRGDPEKLLLVLNNLVRNALRFTAGKPGGKVVVALSAVDGKEVVVSVTDNGIGIPEKDLGKIFDVFTQVESPERRKYGGMGIGLSAVKNLVEAFGGEIRVESREGHGSRFSFSLPAGTAAP